MLEVKEKVHYFDDADYFLNFTGWSDACWEAHDQLHAYLKYLGEGEESLNSEELRKVKALELLEQLGYPMDKLGTYLYVTVIAELVKSLDATDKDHLISSGCALLKEVNDPFSLLYRQLARGNLDMGVKTFHEDINTAIASIDKTRVNGGLAYDIYNGLPGEICVSENAFILASYLTNKTAKKEAKMPYIKTIYERQ